MTIHLEYTRFEDGGENVTLTVGDGEDLTAEQIRMWGEAAEHLVSRLRPRPLSFHTSGRAMDIGAPDPEFLDRLRKNLGGSVGQRWGERTQTPDSTPPPQPNASDGKSWLGRLRGV